MKLGFEIFQSKVARRMLILFFLCALLPISFLAVIAFTQVTTQLNEESQTRMHQMSKALGMSVYERLLFIEEDMKAVSQDLIRKEKGTSLTSEPQVTRDLSRRFHALTWIQPSGDPQVLMGSFAVSPNLSDKEWHHLQNGKSLISTISKSNGLSTILITRLVRADEPLGGILVGTIKGEYLWHIEGEAFWNTEMPLYVLDHTGRPLVRSKNAEGLHHPLPLFPALSNSSGQIQWKVDTGEYLGGYWTIPLSFHYLSPPWVMVVGELKTTALASMVSFKYSFFLVLGLSLLVVIFFSISQIRRSLIPLEELRRGTQRIANKDFSSPVHVSSGDEFEHLAHAFNGMAERLGRQFHTLATIGKIDRAILSSLNTQTIINVVLSRIPDILPADQGSISLYDEQQPHTWNHVIQRYARDTHTVTSHSTCSSNETELFKENRDHVFVQRPDLPPILGPLAHQDVNAFFLFPIVRSGEFVGFITLGYQHPTTLSDEDLASGRQLANQVAIALANAKDVAERLKAEAALQEKNKDLEQALIELKDTQHQVVQQERLRALGQMASGIAHDFNNTLTPIVGFTELMLMNPQSLENKEKTLDLLRLIQTAGQDAAKVVSRLREFYRKRNPEEERLTLIQLNTLITQAILLTQPRWKDQALAQGSTITVETDLQEIPEILGNEAEIREVLINLIFNAVDASPGGGTITLRTYQKDDQVCIDVTDTGVGMTDDVRQKCLEPFFSTKGDRGTGLGLSMVFGIIRRHQGLIHISTVQGEGTTFTVGFPIVHHLDEQQSSPMTQESVRPLHILVVEDDPLVSKVIMEYLAKDHHSVIGVSDGEEALHTFKKFDFDVVVTDKGLPKVSGDQLAAEVKLLSPTTPVIMVTGIADLLDEETKASSNIDSILSKPITLTDLRTALAKVLTHQPRSKSHPKKPTVPSGSTITSS